MLLGALNGAFPRSGSAFIIKILLAMRLTTILLLTTCMHLSARTRAQPINLSEQHTPLDRVFKKITDQTGYLFIYRDEWLKQTRDVSISVHGASLKEVLDICFADQSFTYGIFDKMVVLKEKPNLSLSAETGPQRQTVTVRGRVADSLGAPLVGASIRIKGTTKGTQSDFRGEFELKNIPEGTVLVLSYTGYVSRELTISSKDIGYYFMMLQRSNDELDATVIQAYGTTSRRFNVGSISTVDASTIEKQPVTNVLLALQGQVAGLTVNATSGVPGSKVQIQVRGQNTLLSDPNGFKPYDQPLIIIDGVPFAPQNANVSQLGNLAIGAGYNGGISQLGGISAFNGINPSDIESITVLKDADATSIYGTQGSNGVILVTTRKGKPGKTLFNLAANTGFNSAARQVKLLNTDQYLKFRREAFAQDSVTPGSSPFDPGYAPDLTLFDQNKYTNWQNVIYGKTSNNTDIHASLSGGTYNNTFILSAGYTRSDFNYPGNFADQRLTMHTALHHNSADSRLEIDFGVDFGYDQNNSASFGGGRDVLLPPNMPDLTDPQGNLIWSYKGYSFGSQQFYSYLKQRLLLQSYNLNNSLHLTYKLLSRLSIGVTAGYSRNTTNENSQNPAAAQDPSYINRSATFAQNNFQAINIEPQLDYNVNIGKGILSALAGATYKKNVNYQSTVNGYNYSDDLFLGSLSGAANLYAFDQSSQYKYGAGFGRVKYIYDQQYIISLSGRRDGSSNFGPGRKFGNFGSIGAGWIFTQQKAVKKALRFLSFGKLSGSYGTSGSDAIAPYHYQAFWQAVGFVPDVQGSHPNAPQNLYNPDYSWATKRSLNVAMDLGFFHDRLLFNATYYRDREGNQLGGYPLPIQAGFSTVLQNLPANVQNKGWEFAFTSANIKTRDFTWNSTFNITFNRNKLLSFPNLTASPYASKYVIGKPTSIIFGFRYKDVNPATGLFEFYDAKGQATSAPNYALSIFGGDQVPIANREVKYMGGLGNTLSYKRVSLYLFFQFSSQTAPNWFSGLYSGGPLGLGLTNVPTAVQGQYWTGPGDNTASLQRLVTSYSSRGLRTAGYFIGSSAVYSDDTYVRLKTLSLSYALSDDWLRHLHIHDVRVYCNVQNLFTFTNYKVADPETFSDYTAFPLQRTVAFGLNCNF